MSVIDVLLSALSSTDDKDSTNRGTVPMFAGELQAVATVVLVVFYYNNYEERKCKCISKYDFRWVHKKQ
ncbi:UNVERIFIED_CONTAM: hypothetical protein Sangu_1548900 [Sesamum angustifolium]|uniref:Uncharacterized protein n=1 Tax=Sesamum angustifolium TaxID=2727405 RepID=A0AAW2MTZ4_9LAMI